MKAAETDLFHLNAIALRQTCCGQYVADNKGKAAFCFIPRHGIRAMHNGKTADFVICFECFQVRIYINDKEAKGTLVTDSPQPAFDKILKDAKVPLPKK